MKDSDGMRCPLHCYAPAEAQETLGVHIAVDGSWTKQKEVLKDKALAFVNQLCTHYLDCKEA